MLFLILQIVLALGQFLAGLKLHCFTEITKTLLSGTSVLNALVLKEKNYNPAT